jgi:hypothetical protein
VILNHRSLAQQVLAVVACKIGCVRFDSACDDGHVLEDYNLGHTAHQLKVGIDRLGDAGGLKGEKERKRTRGFGAEVAPRLFQYNTKGLTNNSKRRRVGATIKSRAKPVAEREAANKTLASMKTLEGFDAILSSQELVALGSPRLDQLLQRQSLLA